MAQSTKKKTNRASGKRSAAQRPPAPAPREQGPGARIAGGILCLLLALCIAVSYFNAEAVFLKLLRGALTGLCGYGYWLWAAMLLVSGLFLLLHRERRAAGRVLCALLTTLLGGHLLHLLLAKPAGDASLSALWTEGQALTGGGVLCGGLAELGKTYISEAVFAILAVIGLLVCVFVMLRTTPAQVAEKARQRAAQRVQEAESEPEVSAAESVPTRSAGKAAPRRRSPQIDIPLDEENGPIPEGSSLHTEKKPFFSRRRTPTPDEVLQPPKDTPAPAEAAEAIEPEAAVTAPEQASAPWSEPAKPAEPVKAEPAEPVDLEKTAQEVSRQIEQELSQPGEQYQYPPITLLDQGEAGSFTEAGAEMRSNSKRLADTLRSFGVDARPGEVVRGPSVTRYEFAQPQGVKLSKITNLSDDIALALGVGSVRVAPVPGKISAVGIEVPNRAVTPVRIREVIESREFTGHKSAVAFAVGKDIGGNRIIGDIAKLPHVLIAGTTGSGKSVCTNSLIVSMLYKSTPEEVRFIMVDPKMVELAPYNGIPHLLIPVVTDPKKAAGALQWAVFEMMKRYKLFSESGVKELSAYNALAEQSQPDENGEKMKKLPTVVVVIDELADLMLVAAKEVEDSICRVAQMGRAAGMHLVIATQRPSADVITGLMKANIPSRIAFAVASSMESRIILDTPGAEKLVGKGDMLYAPLGEGKPRRVQGCFITAEEIERVVEFIKETGEASYSEDVIRQIEQVVQEKDKKGSPAPDTAPADDADELLPAAVEVVLETGQASVSMLQRRLKLGYSRAARLVDQMEERGIVGPFEGSKPRQLLIDKAKWQEMQMGKAEPEPEFDRAGTIRDVFESHDALD